MNGVSFQEITVIAGACGDDGRKVRCGRQIAKLFGEIRGDDTEPGVRILQNPLQLLRVELVVDRDGRETCPPDPEHDWEELSAVFHPDADAIACFEAVNAPQCACDGGCLGFEAAVAQGLLGIRDGRTVRHGPRDRLHDAGQIHGVQSPVSAARQWRGRRPPRGAWIGDTRRWGRFGPLFSCALGGVNRRCGPACLVDHGEAGCPLASALSVLVGGEVLVDCLYDRLCNLLLPAGGDHEALVGRITHVAKLDQHGR